MPPDKKVRRFKDLAKRLKLTSLVDAEAALQKHVDRLGMEEKFVIDHYYIKSETLLSDTRIAELMHEEREKVTKMRHEAIEHIRLLMNKEEENGHVSL